MMHCKFRRCWVVLYCATLATICKADSTRLVHAGGSTQVWLRPNASAVEQYAAEELVTVFRKMTGQTLAINTGRPPAREPAIVIGLQSEWNNQHTCTEQGNDKRIETVHIFSRGPQLFLLGNQPRAALYATYTYLQEELGVRWLWPGASGEYIPATSTVTLKHLQHCHSAGFAYRSLAITGAPAGDADTDTWMARNRLNLVSARPGADGTGQKTADRRKKGFIIRVAGHNVVLPDSLLLAHPQYVALVNGRRQLYPNGTSHLCWTNNEVQEQVAQMIAGWWQQDPYPDVIHFYPADQTRYCECETCTAQGDISTRWQIFSRQLLERLNRITPGKTYWTYAYLEYKKPPSVKPADFAFIPYALYDVSYRHPLGSGNAHNSGSLNEMLSWQQQGALTGIRGYEFIIFKTPMFVPNLHWVTDQVQWMRANRLGGYLSEIPYYGAPRYAPPDRTWWNSTRLSLYAVAQALWNPSRSARELLADWCRSAYGPAAAPMQAYYELMEKAWTAPSTRIAVFNNLPASHAGFLSEPVIEKAFELFAQAARLAATTGAATPYGVQVALDKRMFEHWVGYYFNNRLMGGQLRTRVSVHPQSAPTRLVLHSAAGLTARSVTLRFRDNRLHVEYQPVAGEAEPALEIYLSLHDSSALPMALRPALLRSANGTLHSSIALPASAPQTTIRMALRLVNPVSGDTYGWPFAGGPEKSIMGMVECIGAELPATRSLLLYDGGADGRPLLSALQNAYWQADTLHSGRPLNRHHDIVLLRYPSGAERQQAVDSVWAQVREYVQAGGMLVLSTAQSLPLQRWFPALETPTLVKWQGKALKRILHIADQKLSSVPHALHRVTRSGATPVTGFRHTGTTWRELAHIQSDNETPLPFMLAASYGKGTIVLTSSGMGMNAGTDVFGYRHADEALLLLENLLAYYTANQKKNARE